MLATIHILPELERPLCANTLNVLKYMFMVNIESRTCKHTVHVTSKGLLMEVKGGNPLSYATEIIIEIKQFYSGRMA